MYIDMDAFFASIEQEVNPALKGKPVIIGGRNNKYRSIICAASYEAKARGIENAMPSWRALQICPEAIFVPANTAKYIYTSDQIYKILKEFTPQIEKLSIDEFFLDVSGTTKFFGSEGVIAARIKKKIKDRFGLTCSIGVAPTRITARLAAKMNKPDGLCVVSKEEMMQKMHYLPIEKICGIGNRLKRRFNLLGVTTCGELAQFSDNLLRRHFGIVGIWLKEACLAEDVDFIDYDISFLPPKSVGHSQTLKQVTDNQEFIREWIYLLSEMIGQRLRRKELQGKTVYLYVADGFHGGFSKQKTFAEPTYDGHEIYVRCLRIIDLLGIKEIRARVLGVSVSNLSNANDLYLFEEQNKRERLMRNIDRINQRHGEWTVYPASLKRATY